MKEQHKLRILKIVILNAKQETLRVVTIAIICSIFASLNIFGGLLIAVRTLPNICDRAFIAKIVSRQLCLQKNSILDSRLGSKYASTF